MKEVYFSVVLSLLFLQFFISGDNRVETISRNPRYEVTISCKNNKEFYSKKEKVGIQEEKYRFVFKEDFENKEFCLDYALEPLLVTDKNQIQHICNYSFRKVKFRPQSARMYIKNEESPRKQLI